MTGIGLAETASAQAVDAQQAEAMRAEIRELRARLESLESRLGAPAPAQAAAAPSSPPVDGQPAVVASNSTKKPADEAEIKWKGSPQIVEGGQSFKVKGRIQADAGYVGAPKGLGDRGLGFVNEMRRIRLGGEGSFSEHLSYKLELELSDNAVDLVDTFLTFKDGDWQLQLGNQNSFQSLDELTGDTAGSVMERAAFTDAFNFERRMGLGAQYSHGPLIAQLGVFTDDITALSNSSDGVNGGDEDNSYSVDGRLVYAPKLGDVQLHLGASAHWRRLGRLVDSSTRYRQRPFIHATNTRLIGTPSMNVEEETMYGAELAALSGPWYGAAEYYTLRADRLDTPTVAFHGAYAEVGYFLTKGDTRGYKGGIFTNNAPERALGEDGGIGSVQVTVRYDWLDLDDRDIRGGTQNGYIAALVWSPIQYLRFNVNYALLQYTGATATASGDTNYNANVIATRFEFDF
ncbi:phosphate-selective porin [Novosphingobium sp. AP12]|nr:phosphate-selective porin [Novosphingobium sp. AP12]